jgi:mRNA interferase RelE/StbE
VSYKVIFKKSAAKELAELPIIEIPKVRSAIEKLSDNPRPEGVKKLKGSSDPLWRIRIGNYRVIYAVDDVIRIVEIRAVGDRKEIYR